MAEKIRDEWSRLQYIRRVEFEAASPSAKSTAEEEKDQDLERDSSVEVEGEEEPELTPRKLDLGADSPISDHKQAKHALTEA